MKTLTALIGAIPISFVRVRYRPRTDDATPVQANPEPLPRATDWQTDQRANTELAAATMFYLLNR